MELPFIRGMDQECIWLLRTGILRKSMGIDLQL